MTPQLLRQLAGNDALLEVGRQAIEDVLIEWRDARLSEPLRGNGLVVREPNGQPSDVIRFGPEMAVRIALGAMADHLEAVPDGVKGGGNG